ncbi:MAG: lysE type translocator family protein [Verrucomicrobiales bacterium]|nr:lysE type translocator family protein [Verrucomicrobiales bacterium]
MSDVLPMLLACFVGFVTGFLVSIPIGPINITIINEGARRGFHWALLIGFGATAMDLIYCSLSFAGFSNLLKSTVATAAMELFSFVLMAFLGVKYLRLHSISSTNKSATIVEEKLHPHSAFMTGFVRVLGNPGVLLMWITISATFISNEWVEDDWYSKTACIVGVGLGAATWFSLVSYTVSRKHKSFSQQTLVRMSHVSGLFLLGIAAYVGIRLVMLLSRAHHAH